MNSLLKLIFVGSIAGIVPPVTPVAATSQEQSGSATEWVKEATRQYSPASWQLLRRYDALPLTSVTDLNDGSKMISSKPAGTFSYLQGPDSTELLSSMATNVHEIAHAYLRYSIYSFAGENDLRLDRDNVNGYMYLDPDRSFFISFPSGDLFPSRELMQAIPDSLVTYRYDTYISGNTSTQADGVIGLLDEMNAYYLGAKFSYDALEAYSQARGSEQEGLFEWIKNIGSEMTAFYEFDYFIKEYLLRMKNVYPESYAQLKECRSFKLAYRAVREKYAELVSNYVRRINLEMEKINSSPGSEAHIDRGKLWIKDTSTGWSHGVFLFHDDMEKLLTVLGSGRYDDVISDFL